MIAETDIAVGDIVLYKLQEKDRPTDPDREWKGEALSVFPETKWSHFCVVVVLLDPGYEGLDEIIHPWQITQIQRKGE